MSVLKGTKSGSRFTPLYKLTLAYGVVCIAATLLEPEWMCLKYDRVLVLSGQVWRLLTGNFVHLSLLHLGFNLALLSLISMTLLSRVQPFLLGVLVLLLGLAVNLFALWFVPMLKWSVGMSGALYGLLAFGILLSVREHGQRVYASVFAIALLLKTVSDINYGPSMLAEALIGGPIAVILHLIGVVTGMLFWFIYSLYSWSGKNAEAAK